MHDELWAGAELKVSHAEFYLEQMASALQPPGRTAMNAAIQSTGAIIDPRWQRAFYAHLDAFLAMARSVPEVIECCFGNDRVISGKPWYGTLAPDEQSRRQTFSTQFAASRNAFSNHPLTSARNIGLHRTGAAPVEVEITGRFGVSHVGSPVKRIPIAESPHISACNDPALQFAATQSPTLVQPAWQDFSIDGKPLFAECRAYLELAKDALGQARIIAKNVHDRAILTPPPST